MAARRNTAAGSFEKARRIRLQTRKIGGLTAVLRLVRKQAGERVGVASDPQLDSQRTATPTAQGFV